MYARKLAQLTTLAALLAAGMPLLGQQPIANMNPVLEAPAAELPPAASKPAVENPPNSKDAVSNEKDSPEKHRVPANPAPLGEAANKGLEYLANQQHADGGWGQGGGWRQGGQNGGRVEGNNVSDPSDVGNTCIAVLALVRAGNTPNNGPYATNVHKGVEFVRRHIDKADKDSIYVTDVRDTQLQSKIGSYVDTFLAALVLSELKSKGALPENSPALAALNKTIAKIERNQKSDGTFEGNRGWASVLSQGIAGKAINYARQAGVAVNDETLKRDFAQAKLAMADTQGSRPISGVAAAAPATSRSSVSGRASAISGPATSTSSATSAPAAALPSDAGVALYADGSNSARLQDYVNSLQIDKRAAEAVIADANADEAKKVNARGVLRQVEKAEADQKTVVSNIAKRLGDKDFLAGFGNNGGEEFLSYMNIGETLAVQGGDEWKKWSKSMGENLARIQNGDGSWSGQHCITGRTFCTSAALLTLMSDRAPMPTAEKLATKQASK